MYTKKKKIKKTSNRIPEFHYFDGYKDSAFHKDSISTAETAFSGSNLGGSLSSILGGATNVLQAGLDNAKIADTSEMHAEREARMVEQSAATDNASLLAEMSGDVAIGKANYRDVRGSTVGQQIGNTFKGMASGAAAGAKVGGPWGAVAGAAAGLFSGIVGAIAGRSKALKAQAALNKKGQQANIAKAATFANKAGGLDAASDARAAAVFAAQGGRINLPKFPYFDDGITEFNTGGTHEENPYSGIPQGIAADGYPNLVEEGEVKFKDYIFSDRTKPKLNEIMPIYKKAKKKDSFATLAKKISQEAEERPNDVISKTTRDYQLGKLAELQELGRQRRGLKGTQKLLYDGGDLDSKYKDFEDKGEMTSYNLDEMPDKTIPQLLVNFQKVQGVSTPPSISTPISVNSLLSGLTTPVAPISPDTLKETLIKKSYKQQSFPESSNISASLLEATPAITAGVGALTTLFDKTNSAAPLEKFKPTTRPLTYTEVGEKQKYTPIDQQYIYNQAAAQGRAATRGIQQSIANPYASQAYLLSENKNQRNNLGDLGVKIDMANAERRNAVTAFNNQLDLANATNRLKVDSINAEMAANRDKMNFQKAYYTSALKAQDKAARDAALSESLTTMGTELGKLGAQAQGRKMYENYIIPNWGSLNEATQKQIIADNPALAKKYGLSIKTNSGLE